MKFAKKTLTAKEKRDILGALTAEIRYHKKFGEYGIESHVELLERARDVIRKATVDDAAL